MDDNQKKGFLTFAGGVDASGKCVAMHIEGMVVRKEYRAAESDKKSIMRLSVLVGRNPWSLLGEAEVAAQASNPSVNEDKPFLHVILTGDYADMMEPKVHEKSKVLFCGGAKKREYTRKDKTPGASVTVYANSLLLIPTKANPQGSVPNTSMNVFDNVYETRDGKKVKERVASLVTGTVKSVTPVKQVNGKSVINFDFELAIPAAQLSAFVEGTYSKNSDYGKYKIVRVGVWGDRAEHMDNILVPGSALAVTGTVRTNSYNGSDYVNMTGRHLSVLKWGNQPEDENAQDVLSGVPGSPTTVPALVQDNDEEDFMALMDDFDDGDLPF